MDFLKQGLQAYKDSESQSHENVSKTGGAEYNAPAGGQQPSGGFGFNHNEVVNQATSHGSGDNDIFSKAMSFVGGNPQKHSEPIDEEHVTKSHEAAYGQNANPGNMDASSMGSAAAMKALQSFMGGQSGGGSGGNQNQLIAMAMAEASKLFDKSGGAASGNKQDAVSGAAMTVMKLLAQSGGGGSGGGGGGLGGLAGMIGGGNSGGLGPMQMMKMAMELKKF